MNQEQIESQVELFKAAMGYAETGEHQKALGLLVILNKNIAGLMLELAILSEEA